MRLAIKKEQSDIEWEGRFGGAADDMHLAAQFEQGQGGGAGRQGAIDIAQKIDHEGLIVCKG